MTLPVVNFAALPVQGDPYQKMLGEAIMRGMYAYPQADADLQKQQIANALAKNQLQYAPQMSQAELAYKQAQTPYLQAKTDLTGQQAQYFGPSVMSTIGLQGAEANHFNQESKYMPLDYLIRGSTANNQTSRFGGAYQLAKALSSASPAYRASWIAENGDKYADMLSTLGNKALQTQDANQSSPLQQGMASYFPQFSQQANQAQTQPQQPMQQPMQSSNGLPPQLQQAIQQQPQQSMMQQSSMQNPALSQALNQQQNGFSKPTPDQVAQLNLASQLAANKDLTTAATRRQMEGAIQVGDIMNDPDFQAKAVNASQYAGAVGKGKASVDALMQQNPKAYEDYISFVNHDMVLVSNRIKTLDNMSTTDAQREELHGLYDKTMDSFTSNPDQFITQFNNLGKALDRVAKSVSKSASPLFKDNRLGNFNPIGSEKVMKYNPETGDFE